MLRRHTLDDHVLSDIVNPSIYWDRLDNIVVTWILNTLSTKHHEIIQEPMETECQAWCASEAQFLGNHGSCVLQLDARFRALKQGDLCVSDYYHRMKGLTDDLRALGETITNRHLVLNLLQGMNKKFDHINIFIKQS
jgi:hypothetical protein